MALNVQEKEETIKEMDYDRSTISAKLNFQLLKTQISFSELRLSSQELKLAS